jgi:DNA primase
LGLNYPQVDIRYILEYYSVRNLTKIDDEYSFSCPFPEHKRGDQRPSSSINQTTGQYHCFGCGRSGSLITFVAEMEGVHYTEAIRYIREAFSGAFRTPRSSICEELERLTKPKQKIEKREYLDDVYLSLFRVDWDYVYSAYIDHEDVPRILRYPFERGFSLQTVQEWELGYDKISDRLTIPIRDIKGRLVGFKGRTVNKFEKIKYLSVGDKKSVKYGFKTTTLSDHVFGLDSATKSVIVCEGEFDAISLRQKGFTGSVALGGSDPSKAQTKLLKKTADEVYILLDPDEAGRKGARKLARNLAVHLPVRIGEPPKNSDPAEMTQQQITEALSKAQNPILNTQITKE